MRRTMAGWARFQTSGGAPNVRPSANSFVPIAPSAMTGPPPASASSAWSLLPELPVWPAAVAIVRRSLRPRARVVHGRRGLARGPAIARHSPQRRRVEAAVQFAILGPLEVHSAGVPVRVGGGVVRRLLASLPLQPQ